MKVANILCKIAAIVMAVSLLLLPACNGGDSTSGHLTESYTIADSTGDWGYPLPYAHYSRGPGYVRMQFVFETLVWKDEVEFVPQLANEWQYNKDNNSYTFKLQEDVKWHDGTKFTAEDVVFTFNYTEEYPYQWVGNSIVESV